MTTDTYNSLSDDYKAANPRPVKLVDTCIVRWYNKDNEFHEYTTNSRELAERMAADYNGTVTVR